MLLKWIILIVIAWYVFQAAGNLIAAARGGQPPLDGQRGHRNGSSTRPDQQGPDIRVVRKRSAANQGSSARSGDDVEDARYVDL